MRAVVLAIPGRLAPALALAFAAALALAACDTRQDEPTSVTVRDLLRERLTRAGTPAQGFEMPSRAMLDQREAALLYIAAPQVGAEATLSPVAQNGGAVTWLTLDGITVTTRNGLIVATRGMGDDLISADIARILPALADGGQAVRVHEGLSGDNRTETRRFVCEVRGEGEETLDIVGRAVATQRVAEACRGPQARFVNRYWISPDGRIVQSEQWLSPGIGAVTTRRLVD